MDFFNTYALQVSIPNIYMHSLITRFTLANISEALHLRYKTPTYVSVIKQLEPSIDEIANLLTHNLMHIGRIYLM